MCGICGQYNFLSRNPVERELVKRMNDSQKHRGPDDEGVFFDDAYGLGLGHRRLSIIDLDSGHQPMCNEDETIWIVFNGEIYNFKDLRAELGGHGFRTKSDTETIIHAYEEWGQDSLARLNGMYAFALWDKTSRKLVLARDPFGIKPLYYWSNGQTLLFASEIKALLSHPEVRREVDLTALDEYISLTYVPSPRTTFKGISKLQPGYSLVCTPDKLTVERFYRVIPEIETSRSEADTIDELRESIAKAVERQMIADVPVGAMLSGGVDSSTISTIMTNVRGESIETFTVGFQEDFDFNELSYARTMSEKIGSTHHEIVISAEEYLDFMPKSIWHLDEPVATASTLAYYKVCQLARQYVKVVLTGQGADEPFAGYPRHFGERYGSLYRGIPSPIRNWLINPLLLGLPRNEQLKRAVRSLHEEDSLKRIQQIYNTTDSSLKRKLYRDGIEDAYLNGGCEAIRTWYDDVRGLDSLSQLLYLDSRLSLPDNLLMYGDKMAMAVSLEARVPFLDLELMTIVERIPPQMKISGKIQKYILKKAVTKWIPDEVIKRKKIGFVTPVDRWFRKELSSQIHDRLLASDSACTNYFRPKALAAMIEDHRNGKADYKRPLFSLLTFEIWHDLFIKPYRWENRYEN